MGDDMSETTVTEQGGLSQIGSSFKNMFVGLICFIVSWPVLYCGASRIHWNKVFKNAVAVEQAKAGIPAYVTGIPTAKDIGDGAYLPAGKYLKISKNIEAYAWVEKKKEESETRREGTKKVTETKTTYEYALEWTSDPKPAAGFNQTFWGKYCKNANMSMAQNNPVITDAEKRPPVIYTPECKVGGYDIDVPNASFYSGSKSLDTVYLKGKPDAPKLGDKRIAYTAFPSDIEYTFAGSVSGKKIVPFIKSDNDRKLAASAGDFNTLIAGLKSEDFIMGVVWFLAGFILMAAGLNMLVGPVTALLDFIPFIGGMGSGIIRFVLGFAALVLSAVFWWVIKLWWLVLLVIIAIVAYGMYRKKAAKTAAT